MKLGTEGYSPAIVAKIEYAGANHGSFAQASRSLGRLAEMSISAMHVQRITERLGRERAQERDRQVEQFQAGECQPAYGQAPAVAAVHVDAGKAQCRQEQCGPGVHGRHWSDDKVACLVTYAPNPTPGQDPRPEPPKAFLDRPAVLRLCQEIRQVRGDPTTAATAPRPTRVPEIPPPKADGPKVLVRTAVATMQPVEAFGWMVAAEAMRRGFYEAAVRAVLGDGGNWIVPLAHMHFDGWIQVLDFIHLLTHLYAAATAAYRGRPPQAWACYRQWLRWAWTGGTKDLMASMNEQADRLGPAPAGASDDDPRRIVALTCRYLADNAERMDYPAYRRAGLPVTSAAVESLIKQFNQRLKGTEKFWLRGGAEAVLQSRAAYLSDDGRAEDFFARRPRGPAVGQNRRRLVA